MLPDEHRRMAELEWRHWWFTGTRKVLLAELDRHIAPCVSGLRLLDLGCGTGYTTSLLEQRGRVVGIDASALAARYARARCGPRATLLQADGRALPLESGRFHAATAFDILEHVDDDAAVAAELLRVLRPGGWLIASVPAFPLLWSEHDVALGHVRRYRRSGFVHTLTAAGFEVVRASYYNTILFCPAAGVRLLSRAGRWVRERWSRGDARRSAPPSSDLRPTRPALNGILADVLGAERHVLARADLPVGLSLLAAARRPGGPLESPP